VPAPTLVRRVAPSYPPMAKAGRVQGTVRFNAVIGRDGSVVQLALLEGHPMLVESALAAVKQWVYSPTVLNGVPVEVQTEVQVNFTLSQ
jgi:periplasmic protein TonB